MYDPILQEIIDHFLDEDEDFFHKNCIHWSTKGGYTILNYRQDAERNQYNNWCRALVLDQHGKVRSLPFARFFNRGEKDAHALKIDKCHFLEKMDGCLIGVFFDDDNKPVLHTRRTISTHEPDWNMQITTFTGKKACLLKLAAKYLEDVDWWKDDYDCCFAFEMIHEATQVVTEYPEDRWGMYLIGGRHLETMEEMNEGELLAIAHEMQKTPGVKVFRPYDWRFEDENELQSVLLSMPDDFEGFVARDVFSDRRMKIKKPSYLERHHMIDQKKSIRGAIPIWLKGETEEVLAYFPDAKEKFDALDKAYAMFLDTVRGIVTHYQQEAQEKGWTKKDLAEAVIEGEPHWVHIFIFKLWDKPWADDNLWQMLVRKLPDVKAVEDLLVVGEAADAVLPA